MGYSSLMYLDELTGHRLRVATVEAKLTQRQLADLTGFALNTVSRHMRGETPMSVAQLVRYANALGVPMASLLPRLDSNQQPFDLQTGPGSAPEPSLAGVA